MLIVIKNIRRAFSYEIKSPLSLSNFRHKEKAEEVKQSMIGRFRNQKIVDEITKKLEVHRLELHRLQCKNKDVNSLNKELKSLFKSSSSQSKMSEIQKLKIKLKQLKNEQQGMQSNVKQLGKNIQSMIGKVGNILHQNTPISKEQKDNVIIKFNDINKGDYNTSYQEICQRYQITDLKRGQKVSGHRGYFLKKNGLKLSLALTQYAIDFLQQSGYSLYQAPAIISDKVLEECCQLSTIDQDMYHLQGQKSYLIATSQQSLAAYYKNQIVELDKPIKMGGYSTCFRKEAGAHGKDIHGIFRVHQFQKVQQFVIAKPQQSQQEMDNMIQISQKFYKSLNVPFRVVDVVSGELNDAASRKYDLQAWYPSQQKYRQLVSVSNCTDYQSRLLNVQYVNNQNVRKYPHMLNGTLIAIQRTLTCLLQNYYRGKYIEVPQVLVPYTRVNRIYEQ